MPIQAGLVQHYPVNAGRRGMILLDQSGIGMSMDYTLNQRLNNIHIDAGASVHKDLKIWGDAFWYEGGQMLSGYLFDLKLCRRKQEFLDR